MSTIAQHEVLAKIPVKELEAEIEQYLEPVTRQLPEKRLKQVVRLATRGISGAQSPVVTQMARSEFLVDLARRLETITPHMLRHSPARRMLERGAQLPEVQRVLGHSRPSTRGVYLTPSEEDLRSALGRAGL